MITSDLTMIVGIAHGLNLLFGVDLLTCICLAAVSDAVLPFFFTLLSKGITEVVYVSIAGFALVLCVLGVLISQPDIPLSMNIFTPKLSGESAHLLMALLGANIMAHNFYTHSTIVQHQRRHNCINLRALFHDHFSAILFIFIGIFLVNYVLMNMAAAFFSNVEGLLNFQDVSLLLDQIFRTPVAPLMFLFILLMSCQITDLTWSICRQSVLQHFFGANLSIWHYHMLAKTASVIPASIFANIAGSEGVYQLLIVCQIIQAMLLPASVIPLFRIASSKLIMGIFRIPRYLEILALIVFLGMLTSNVAFLFEILFGDNSWINNLKGSMGSSVQVLYVALLLAVCMSIVFTLYLAVTPLRSSRNRSEIDMWDGPLQKSPNGLSASPDDSGLHEGSSNTDLLSPLEHYLESSTVDHQDISIMDTNQDHSETALESDDCSEFVHGPNVSQTYTTFLFPSTELKSVSGVDIGIVDMVPSPSSSDANILQVTEPKSFEQRDLPLEVQFVSEKCAEVALESEESARQSVPSSYSEDYVSVNPETVDVAKLKGSDSSHDSGSLLRCSGLGRGTRRQLASILDDFWGQIFDFHGRPTPEASRQKLDIVLGLDSITSSAKTDRGTEFSKSPFTEAEVAAVLASNSVQYNSPSQKIFPSTESTYGGHIGSPWTQRMQLLNKNMQSSSGSHLLPDEKCYASLNLRQYNGSYEYQPATIHGYQIASYLKTIGAGANPYSNISQDPLVLPKTSASLTPTMGDPLLYSHRRSALGSLGLSGLQSPTLSSNNRMQTNRPFYEPLFHKSSESVGSAPTKKYHTSPDISALIAAGRNSALNEAMWGGPIGPKSSLGRMSSGQGQYVSLISPPGFHKDVLPPQAKMNPDTKSLWSKQPFEQLFGGVNINNNQMNKKLTESRVVSPEETLIQESEYKLLQALRFCILKLLKLDGSDWLFRQNDGCDEELINRLAASEKRPKETDGELNQLSTAELEFTSDRNVTLVQKNEELGTPCTLSVHNCGDGCTWRASLVVSFGVWCVRRILEMSLVESRPELWGKYTYVLNRLQGILDAAFSKPRKPLATCWCLEMLPKTLLSFNKSPQSRQLINISKPISLSFTNASMILEIIKDIEVAISGRKGRTGTAAGDIAFPKGKENLASVLKRYKRRLSNKFPAAE